MTWKTNNKITYYTKQGFLYMKGSIRWNKSIPVYYYPSGYILIRCLIGDNLEGNLNTPLNKGSVYLP
jgi:hypothetical protein